MSNAARFEIVEHDPHQVVLRDLGPWNEHPTITNDAEGVVERLILASMVKADIRLLYFDSEGEVTELRHDGHRFTGFGPGPSI